MFFSYKPFIKHIYTGNIPCHDHAPARLKKLVGSALSTSRSDVLSIKTALSRLGLFEDPEHGITSFPDTCMFEDTKRFQRTQNLAADGVMRRRGPTLGALNRALVRDDIMRNIRPGAPPWCVDRARGTTYIRT